MNAFGSVMYAGHEFLMPGVHEATPSTQAAERLSVLLEARPDLRDFPALGAVKMTCAVMSA